MFERYTERARRVIFFARYEASQHGSMTIETEHMLLGLMREDRNVIHRVLPNTMSVEALRREIEGRLTVREKVATSVDLPLSQECKRVLAYAAEEAHLLSHPHIGTDHLLLGILREETSMAADVLVQHGFNLPALREQLSHAPLPPDQHEVPSHSKPAISAYDLAHSPALPKSGVVPDVDTALRIAEAVWTPLYGAETIKSQAPLQAELRFNIWLVTGSGAVANDDRLFAVILQADGRMLSVGRGPAHE
jgi:hypothetical protein